MMVRALILCLAVGALSPAAIAAGALSGVKEVAVVVEALDDDAERCGITEAILTRALSDPIATSKLKIVPRSGVSLSAQVTVLQLDENACAASYDVKAYSYQSVSLAATRRETMANVVLWQKSGIHSDSRARFAGAISDVIEELSKAFVVAWAQAQ
jgi:hypothetical protein